MTAPYFIPDLEPGDLPDTREAGEPWHIGLMVTRRRAAVVAAELFPDDVADGSDCQIDRALPGAPCVFCMAKNQEWAQRVRATRAAMLKAFS